MDSESSGKDWQSKEETDGNFADHKGAYHWAGTSTEIIADHSLWFEMLSYSLAPAVVCTTPG